MKNVLYKSVLKLLFTPINPSTHLIFLKNIQIAVKGDEDYQPEDEDGDEDY
jgi:hypothetical protein